jgi:hypothetical protein
MAKLFAVLAGAAMMVGASGAWAQACMAPAKPSVPNGNEATQEQMLAARTEVQAYLKDAGAYQACLDQQLEAKKKAHDAAKGSEKEKLAAEYTDLTKQYNASAEEQEGVGAAFNTALRAYNARQQ